MKVAEINQLSFFETKVSKNSYKEICSKISDNELLSPDEFGKAIKKWAKKTIKKPINITCHNRFNPFSFHKTQLLLLIKKLISS